MHILKFSSSTCIPCKSLSKNLKDVNIPVSNIDIAIAPDFAKEMNVRSVPTMILLDEKKQELDRITGLVSADHINSWIRLYENV